jgi:murein DD-endopeptidase / murein LD-carboxypeptidase
MHNKLKKNFVSFRYLIAVIIACHLMCFLGPLEIGAKQLKKKCGSLKFKTIRKSAPPLVSNEIPFQAEVRKYIGIPYKRGGTGKKGIDCSGLAKNIYADVFGIELPHNSYEQSCTNFLEPVPLSTASFEANDLLFFTGGKKKINHVGIYLKEGKFIHATPKRGVVISDLNESSYFQRHLVASRRIKKSVLAKAQGQIYSSAINGKDILLNQNISLGYVSPTQNQLGIRVETFLERNLSATDDTSMWPINLLSGDVETDLPMDVETWQGVRASADIRPVRGMRITPSMSVIDGVSLLEREHQRWQTYGIEAAIAPTGSSWSIALSLYSILNPEYMKDYRNMEGTDMGLRFNYQVSDTVRFSLNGKWGDFGAEKENQNLTNSPEETQDLSFNLGVSF